MASFGAVLLLWGSPRYQRELLPQLGERLDLASHQMIRHLAFRGPLRPSRLAAELRTGKSNISKIIGRLEELDFVERVVDERDGRASLVRLTSKGVRAAECIIDLGDQLAAEILRDWPAEDVAEITRLMGRFADDALKTAERLRHRPLGEWAE